MNVMSRVMLNGVELSAAVSDGKGGLRLELDAGEWRGLGLKRGDRVRFREGAGEVWYFVERVSDADGVAVVRLVRDLDGRPADPDSGTALNRGVLPKPEQRRLDRGPW